MAQATLIDSTGKKVVVEAGSQQAQQYFGQGYKLMPTAPAVPTVPTAAPTGSVAIDGTKYGTRELQQANFTNIQPVGNTLYGVPKPLDVPDVAPKYPADVVADPNLGKGYQDALKGNYELALSKQNEIEQTASQSDFVKEMKERAEVVKSNLTMTFSPDQQKQNLEDLLGVQRQIRSSKLASSDLEDTTDKAISDVDYNNNLLTSQGQMSQAQIAREATFKSRALSRELQVLTDNEANLLSMVNLSAQEKRDIVNGQSTIADFQERIQTYIDNEKKSVLDQASKLDELAQSRFASAVEAYKGVDMKTLSPTQLADFSTLVRGAGLDPDLVFKGIEAVNKQQALDNSLKGKQIIGDAENGYYQFDATTGKTTLVKAGTGKKVSVSDQLNVMNSGFILDENGNVTDPAKGIVEGFDISRYATDPNHEESVASIIQGINSFSAPQEFNDFQKSLGLDSEGLTTEAHTGFKTLSDVDAYIKQKYPNSPITAEMISKASEKYQVPWEMLVAMMEQDSSLGTAGKGARTFNPGNVGNDDAGNIRNYGDWQSGVNAVADWLNKHRASTGGGDTAKATEILSMATNASSGLSVNAQKENKKLVQNLLAQGNEEGAMSQVKTMAYNGLGQTEKTTFDENDNARANLEYASALLANSDVDTGPYKALYESAKPYALIKTDDKYTELRMFTDIGQAQLRKAFFGTAVTETEQKASAGMLASPNDSMETLVVKMRLLPRILEFANDAKIAKVTGAKTPKLSDYISVQASSADLSYLDSVGIK